MSGEVIDISFIPAQTTLAAAKISNEFSDGKITMD
jgi:hypothetical protein